MAAGNDWVDVAKEENDSDDASSYSYHADVAMDDDDACSYGSWTVVRNDDDGSEEDHAAGKDAPDEDSGDGINDDHGDQQVTDAEAYNGHGDVYGNDYYGGQAATDAEAYSTYGDVYGNNNDGNFDHGGQATNAEASYYGYSVEPIGYGYVNGDGGQATDANASAYYGNGDDYNVGHTTTDAEAYYGYDPYGYYGYGGGYCAAAPVYGGGGYSSASAYVYGYGYASQQLPQGYYPPAGYVQDGGAMYQQMPDYDPYAPTKALEVRLRGPYSPPVFVAPSSGGHPRVPQAWTRSDDHSANTFKD